MLQETTNIGLELISFQNDEIELFNPLENEINATNGDSFLCCFSLHIHLPGANNQEGLCHQKVLDLI